MKSLISCTFICSGTDKYIHSKTQGDDKLTQVTCRLDVDEYVWCMFVVIAIMAEKYRVN